MKFTTLFFVVCLLGLAFHCHQQTSARKAIAKAKPDAFGFIPLALPNEAEPGKVFIMGPLNCPSPEGRKSDALAETLKNMGILCTRTDRISLPSLSSDQNAVWEKVFKDGPPLVFVGMRVRSNPDTNDIIAEYKQWTEPMQAKPKKGPKVY